MKRPTSPSWPLPCAAMAICLQVSSKCSRLIAPVRTSPASTPRRMTAVALSMKFAFRVVVAFHTVAGRGRASSPAPEGPISLRARRSYPGAIAAAPPRLGRSPHAFARFHTPGSRRRPDFAGQPAAAGTDLNNRPAAALLFPMGRAGRSGSAAANLVDGARSIPCLRVAPLRGAGKS